MKTIWRIGSRNRGMSTILAALLLVVIVVVLGGIVYAFSSGLITGLQGQAAGATSTEELSLDTYTATVAGNSATLFLRNTGGKGVSVATVYLKNSTTTVQLVSTATTPNTPISLSPNVVSQVTINPGAAMAFQAGREYTATLITTQGTQFVYTIRT